MATVPTAPLLSIRPKVTSQTLEFWWRPPTSDGGSPITTYILSDGTNFVSTIGNPGYYKVTGLTNGQNYSYSLAASNGVGIGPYSFYRTVQPGDKPDPPTNVSYADQGSGNVTVSWTNPANIGGTTNLLGMLVRAYQVSSFGTNLSSFSSLVSLNGGVANGNYIYQFKSLSLSNDWQFQVQLQNDPGRTLRTVGFTSTFLPVIYFSPSSIGAMQLWLDATEVNGAGLADPADGASISTWFDKSGRANNAIGQSNPTMSTLSSLQTVYFNTKSMNTPMPTGGSNYSVFITANHSPAAGFQRILNGGGSTSNAFMFIGSCNAGQYASFVGNGATFTETAVNTPATSVGNRMSLLEMTVGTGSNFPFVNGSNQLVKVGTNAAFSTLNIGGLESSGASQMFTGYVGEIIFYSTVVLPGQRQLIEGHLAWKWGISTLLPTVHPFFTRRPLQGDSNLDFSPSSLSSLTLWYDFNDLTTVSSTRFFDKSSSSNTATASGATATAGTFNGRNTRIFTAGYSFASNTVFSNALNGCTVLMTYRPNISGQQNGHPLFASAPASGSLFLWSDGSHNEAIGMNGYQGITTGTFPHATWNLYEIHGLSTVNSTIIYKAGTAVASNVYGNGYTSTTYSINLTNGSPSLGEMLVYKRAVDFAERLQLEGYLAWKWGLNQSLPSTHLYFARAPTRLDTFRSFSPSSISGLSLWLDAADATTLYTTSNLTTNVSADGDRIGGWIDKSSNAYVFYQASNTSFYPTYKTNIQASKPVARFSSSYLYSSNTMPFYTSASSGGTFFIVTQVTNVATQGFFLTYPNQVSGTFCVSESEFGYATGSGTSGNIGFHQGCSIGSVAPGGSLVNNTYTLVTAILSTSGTTPTNTLIWKNGSTLSVSANNGGFYSAGSYPNTNSNQRVRIGARVLNTLTADAFLAGDIAEIIWSRSVMSVAERQQVEGYLAWKWGLQTNLPATHPFRYGSTISLGPITS